MRVVVDVPSAQFGGIRTYVANLLAAWADHHPDDELLVVLSTGSDLDLHGYPRHELPTRSPAALTRPLAQTLGLPRAVRTFHPDSVLSVMPATSLRRLDAPHAVVVHDLRHELRPDQFTRGQRALRRIAYSRAYAVADGLISVSARTQADLIACHPSLSTKPHTVVHHGADHVQAWPVGQHRGPAVAFAHHTNKNPDLVIDGWRIGASEGLGLPPVLIVGTGPERPQLQAQVAAAGLDDHIEIAPYLSDEDFRSTMANASMVVMTSDFEGFGLPVLEGMRMGVPVVIGPDQAMLEAAGGHASVLTDWTPRALADAVARANGFGADHLDHAREHAAGFTWARSVAQTRGFLEGLARV